MTQRIAICGADGDKLMFVPKYAHSREDMHVYHTFDCLLETMYCVSRRDTTGANIALLYRR